MKKLLFAFIALCFLSLSAHTYTIFGYGNKSCGNWIEARKNRNEFEQVHWILGYVSAAGYFGENLKDTEYYAMTSWMDNYCQKNPLKSLENGTIQLINALKIRQ